MADTDVQGMLVRIEATTAQLRQEIARGESAVAKASAKMDGSLGVVDKAFDRTGASASVLQRSINSAFTGMTYQRKHGLKTVKAIISRWAPSVENDTTAYVRAVEANTGTRPGAEIDLSQPTVMTGFVKAIIHHENAGYAYPNAVVAEGVRRALA